MDVFEAFPEAIVTGAWQIAPVKRGTVVGAVWDAETAVALDVIVDDGVATSISDAPDAQPIDADLLIYAKPQELPTTNPRELVAGYMLCDTSVGDYYAIVNASIGKNQDTGALEHVEMLVKQTEVVR